MSEEFVQLKWNTHQLAFLETLSSLRDKQVYTDVTLSCGDQFYPAHRLVLSSCSTFLARALEVASCRSPVLLLHGIEQSTLEQLLMFMYDGQVTISKHNLPKLLKAAHWMGIKGLESAHDKYGTCDSSVETNSSHDFNSSQLVEIWKQVISSFVGTNKNQGENVDVTKLHQHLASIADKFQKHGDEHVARPSTSSQLELLDVQTRQEIDDQDSTNSTVDRGTVDDQVSTNSTVDHNTIPLNSLNHLTEHFMGSSFTPEQNDNGNIFVEEWEETKVDIAEKDERELVSEVDVSAEPIKISCMFEPQVEAETDTLKETVDESCISECPAEAAKDSKENSVGATCKRSLRCKHCKKSFKVRIELAKHLRTHHDQTSNYCFICHTKLKSAKEFKLHSKIHKANSSLSCNLCNFVAPTSHSLKKHLLAHEDNASPSSTVYPGVKVLAESKQKQKLKSKAALKSFPTTKLDKVECSLCLKLFKDNTKYKEHKAEGCKGIIKSKEGYHCPTCIYVGSRRRSVEDHMSSNHTGIYRFRCSFCPYQCRRNFALQEHIGKRHPERK